MRALLFVVGLLVGGVAAGLYVKSLWDKDSQELIDGCKDAHTSWASASSELSKNSSMLEAASSSSFDAVKIKACAVEHGIYQEAISSYLRTQSDLPPTLLLALANLSNPSAQSKQMALATEADRLLDSCLLQARLVPFSGE